MADIKQQQEDFNIKTDLGKLVRIFMYSQFFRPPPKPDASFAGKTVIVTGSNVGLGLEASRHFYRLNAAKLILAVRNVSKGEAAKEDIVSSVPTRDDTGAIEVWQLDQASNKSTTEFSERVTSELSRLDAIVLNAGINTSEFRIVQGYEQCVQVNVLNTFLLALSILPKLRDTKKRFPGSTPHLSVVSSEAHHLTTFDEINAPNLYDKLNEEAAYSQQPRYMATKLMEVLLLRELVSRLKSTPDFATDPVTINLINPGLCWSNLERERLDSEGKPPFLFGLIMRILARTTEVGGRCLVLAASAPEGSHGEFQSDGQNQDVEAWIYTDVGKRVQKKVWEQTMPILEARKPGLLKAVGL